VEFIDGEGNIIVPKAVRPIVDLKETAFGSKNGARKQYRYGNLHIREYDNHYTVHMDRVDPLKNPLGHLLVDAPEYLAGAAAAGASKKARAADTLQSRRHLPGTSQGPPPVGCFTTQPTI
jgi:hypothetical protein